MAWQLQRVLDEPNYLDPFHSRCMPRYEIETALVTLVDDSGMSRMRIVHPSLPSQCPLIPCTMVSFWVGYEVGIGQCSFLIIWLLSPRQVLISVDRE